MFIEQRLESIENQLNDISKILSILAKENADATQPALKENPKVKEVEKPAEPKKTKEKKESKLDNTKNNKTVIGLIDNQLKDEQEAIISVKTAMVNHPTTNVPTKKWSFLIDDKRYGTFDESLANRIMKCVDDRILVKFKFTERHGSKPGVILNDITGFSQATADEVKQ